MRLTRETVKWRSQEMTGTDAITILDTPTVGEYYFIDMIAVSSGAATTVTLLSGGTQFKRFDLTTERLSDSVSFDRERPICITGALTMDQTGAGTVELLLNYAEREPIRPDSP